MLKVGEELAPAHSMDVTWQCRWELGRGKILFSLDVAFIFFRFSRLSRNFNIAKIISPLTESMGR